jgi:hypothetical protein
VQRAEFEILLRAPGKCSDKRRGHVLEASFTCGCLADAVRVSFDGDSPSRETTGRRGVLTVTRAARLADGSWRLTVRLVAPDRADGNPGTLPLGACRFEAQVDDAKARLTLDFGRIPFAPGLSSLRWLSTIDAGCRYLGR